MYIIVPKHLDSVAETSVRVTIYDGCRRVNINLSKIMYAFWDSQTMEIRNSL